MKRPNSVNYVITRQSYIKVQGKDKKEKRKFVIDTLNKQMNEMKHTENICYFDDERVLILWNGYKNEKKLIERFGLSEDYLLSNFCQEIRECGLAPTKLYITSPKDLCDEGWENPYIILQRILNIWKESAIVPIFINDNFLEQTSKEQITDIATPIRKDMAAKSDVLKRMYRFIDEVEQEALTDESIFKMDYTYFCRFFTSIEKLLAFRTKMEPSPQLVPFIELYFKWQTGEISVEKVVDTYMEFLQQTNPEKGTYGMSIKTWYRHKDEFEASPVYPEYLNAHRRILILDNTYRMQTDTDYGKKGYIIPKAGKIKNLKNFVESYTKAIEEYLHSNGNTTFPDKKMYDTFPDIYSVIDVPRIYMAAKNLPEDLTSIGFLKSIYEKRNEIYTE